MVRITWNKGAKRVFCEGTTDVNISPPANDAHRVAALDVLSTQGNRAIDSAMENEVLKPHFIMPYFRYKKPIAACAKLDQASVLTSSEISKITTLPQEYPKDQATRETIAKPAQILERKLAQLSGYGLAHTQTCKEAHGRLNSLIPTGNPVNPAGSPSPSPSRSPSPSPSAPPWSSSLSQASPSPGRRPPRPSGSLRPSPSIRPSPSPRPSRRPKK